jgi:hypothetical protein
VTLFDPIEGLLGAVASPAGLKVTAKSRAGWYHQLATPGGDSRYPNFISLFMSTGDMARPWPRSGRN